MSTFVARQPIFDRQKRVHGYELLFRSGNGNSYDGTDGDSSTLDVITNSLLVIGLDDLTCGKRGFINFTRNLLIQDIGELLPRHAITIEVLEDVEGTEEVLEACRRLKTQGYSLAMDDFTVRSTDSPLLPLADIVKVDFFQVAAEDRRNLCRAVRQAGAVPLAEKVETQEEFSQAAEWGYEYFQGYFFAKPDIRSGKRITGSKLTYLRMLAEISKPMVSYERIEELIKQDVSLTYRLMKFMNSAWFGFRSEIRSIHHALVLLGPGQLKKWFTLIALRYMGSDKPDELILCSLIRARTAEDLAERIELQDHGQELFLTGTFSVIDALTDSPMEEVLAQLPLNERIKKALISGEGAYGDVLDVIKTYEKGLWDSLDDKSARLGIDQGELAGLCNDARRWAQDTLATMA